LNKPIAWCIMLTSRAVNNELISESANSARQN
jgi:hypothetical protein